jgi:fatty acid desaturase
MKGYRVPRGSPPPIRYPMPSRTEAQRRVPSAAISIMGLIFILATLFGVAYIRLGDWPLGVVVIATGVFVVFLLWMIFRRGISS